MFFVLFILDMGIIAVTMAHMSYAGYLVRMGTKMHCKKCLLGVLFTMSNKLYFGYLVNFKLFSIPIF